MTQDQKIVAAGAASGVLAMIASVTAIYRCWPVNPELTDVASRLAYALQMNAVAILPLLVGIVFVGNGRFLSEAIDPTLNKESVATQINGRVVDNTLQQFILFAVGTLALSAKLSGPQMRAIPAVTLVFVVGRLAFWIGYRMHPLYRAFGMAATAYLNIGLLGFALWKFLA